MIKVMLDKIEDIMENRCVQRGNLVQYNKKWFWKAKPGEKHLNGFKRVFPEYYNNEVNVLFDELQSF
jgi:hypothetical protein